MPPEPEPASFGDPVRHRAPRGQRLARLAFVLSLAPGTVVTMILAPALRSPVWLGAGMALLGLALVGRHRLARWILARAGGPDEPETPTTRPSSPEMP